MNARVAKRSVIINGHKKSVSLEEPFWTELKSIAAGRRIALQQLISEVDGNGRQNNLASALRLFVLDVHRQAADAGAQPADPEVWLQ